jgi:tetratricopeptide (TPR) repeat protein
VLGDDHPDTLTSLSNYAVVLQGLGRFDEAEPMHKEAVERCRRVLGEAHPQTLSCLNNYASMLSAQRRYSEAEPLQKDLLAAMRRVRGADHPNAIFATYSYATTLQALGRFDEAAPLFGEVYERSPHVQIPPQRAASLMASYGPVLVRLKQYQQAEAPLREAYRRLRETNQAQGAKMRDIVAGLAIVCERTDRSEEALQWRRELQTLRGASSGPASEPATRPARP